jgi:hypothetical protein
VSDDLTAYDVGQAAEIVSRALGVVGGAELVVGSLHTPARNGRFRSSPEQVVVGQWRYEATRDGRLTASHVVAGIVIAELVLPSDEAGVHVARALAEHISDHGSRTVPAVRSMLEGLAVAAGP